MPMLNSKPKKDNNLRNSEYYGLQKNFDCLYTNSKQGAKLNNLMNLIKSEDNIMLAYRNIKRNKGSLTSGVSKETIKDIENLSKEFVVNKIQRKLNYYEPKSVRRVEIPKA